MTQEQVTSLKSSIGITVSDLQIEAAVEWLEQNTTVDTTNIDNLPATAKLFISKFCEVNNRQSGIASESIDGLSQSFSSENNTALIWDLANSLLGSYLKSSIQFIPAQRRWV